MKNPSLTEQAVAFEKDCSSLRSQTLKDVYYEYDVEGYDNFRNEEEAEFEYIPESKLCIQTNGDDFFIFFDSSRFLENYGYYTLDIKKVANSLPQYFTEKSKSKENLWKPYIGEKITNTVVIWDSLDEKRSDVNASKLYPKSLTITFSNQQMLAIVAAEPTTYDKKNKRYNFMLPDESLVLFFSKDVLKRHEIV